MEQCARVDAPKNAGLCGSRRGFCVYVFECGANTAAAISSWVNLQSESPLVASVIHVHDAHRNSQVVDICRIRKTKERITTVSSFQTMQLDQRGWVCRGPNVCCQLPI